MNPPSTVSCVRSSIRPLKSTYPPVRPTRKLSVEFVDIQEVLQIAKELESKKEQTSSFPGTIFNEYTPTPSIQLHGPPRRSSELIILPTKLHTPTRFERFTMNAYRMARRLKSSLLSCVCSLEEDPACTVDYDDLRN